jgi:hypothetical protein
VALQVLCVLLVAGEVLNLFMYGAWILTTQELALWTVLRFFTVWPIVVAIAAIASLRYLRGPEARAACRF